MTQYMLSVHHRANDPEVTHDDMQRMYGQVAAFNESVTERGIWVFGGGLEPRETATVVDGRDGKRVVTDGPFIEAKEWLGGFWVVELPDLDAAIALAEQASAACESEVEVRPLQGG